MNNFIFRNPTKILFGKGMEEQVGVEAAAHGSRILLHYGSDRVQKSGLLSQTIDNLEAAGLHVETLGGVQPNPRLSLVEQGIALCRGKKLDMILALGGGSVIDSAKAIAVGVPYDGSVWDFYTGAASPQAALPLATILTIPAAGSESSNASVISNDDGDLKRGLGSDLIYPVFSILNPEFCYTIPPYHIAAGASDILAHLMERYFTNVTPVELTDQLLEATMRTLISIAPRVLENPEDYNAWSELMLTGQIAHNNSLDVGRTGDWASHEIEHEVSGIYDVIHGAGLAVIFPAWMEHVCTQDVQRFVRWSVEVWGVEQDYFHPERTVRAGIAALRSFSASIGMPLRLSDMDVGEDRLEEMAAKATRNNSHNPGNFVKLTQDDVLQIYRLAR